MSDIQEAIASRDQIREVLTRDQVQHGFGHTKDALIWWLDTSATFEAAVVLQAALTGYVLERWRFENPDKCLFLKPGSPAPAQAKG